MSKEKGKIYKITNLSNNLLYIGCTIHELDKRLSEHVYRSIKTDSNTKLANSIRKYGVENFRIDLITECDLDKIYETEIKYIIEYDSYNCGLNSTFGGEGCIGYKHSPEIRRKISEKTKNGNSHKGKTYLELYGESAESEKQKRSISVKNKWETMSDEEKEQRSSNIRIGTQEKNSKYGVKLITEIKNKIRDGASFREVKEQYPEIKNWLYYSLKNNNRWVNI